GAGDRPDHRRPRRHRPRTAARRPPLVAGTRRARQPARGRTDLRLPAARRAVARGPVAPFPEPGGAAERDPGARGGTLVLPFEYRPLLPGSGGYSYIW